MFIGDENLLDVCPVLHPIFADVLHSKVDELKSGHGAVLESGHLLILGWSDKVTGVTVVFICRPAHASNIFNPVRTVLIVFVM